MPWTLLLDWRVWAGASFVALGLYAAVQRLEKERAEVALEQFKAVTEREAAAAKVAAARQEALQAMHAQEVLDGLQTRYAALDARYKRLRADADSRPVPTLSDAAAILGPCPFDISKPNPAPGFLAEIEGRVTSVLEEGDRELAKYRQLWELQLRNSAPSGI